MSRLVDGAEAKFKKLLGNQEDSSLQLATPVQNQPQQQQENEQSIEQSQPETPCIQQPSPQELHANQAILQKHSTLQELKNEYEQSETYQHDRFKKRAQALAKILDGNTIRQQKRYTVTTGAHNLLVQANISVTKFTSCTGNQIQHILHAEFVTMLNEAGSEQFGAKQYHITKTFVNFIDVGHAYNQANQIIKATTVADYCWSFLDCIKACGEGVIEGAVNIAHAVRHPIETIQHIASSVTTAGYFLGKIVLEVMEINRLEFLHKKEEAATRSQEFLQNIERISVAIYEQLRRMPPRELVRRGTAMVTETYLTGKCLKALGSFFQQAKKSLSSLPNRLLILQKLP